LLVVSNVTKRYGDLVALDQVSVEFRPGEIHAVLGENGAGKSTLMGVLSGFVRPDAGTVVFDDALLPLGNAFLVKRRGIEMIHQHFTLVPAFTAAENLALGRVTNLLRPISVVELAKNSLRAAERLGWNVDPDRPVRDLAVGAQQRLEILKALGGEARVIVFDEPTAVLAPGEVSDLFRVLRQLRDEGRVVILIAHKLSEVMAVANYVTVLRRGKVVASCPLAETNPEQLATWMVGEMPASVPRTDEAPTKEGLVASGLTVRGDRGEEAIKSVRFEIRRGEIVGFGGVDGNGQVELAEALTGIRSHAGDLRFGSQPFNPDSLPLAYVPQDRQTEGLGMGLSIQDNLLTTGHRRPDLTRGPFLRPRKIVKWAEGLMHRFSVKASSPREGVANLSGGNQQKVVVARALDRQPDLLVVVNPTRGLDIRATEFVHRQILAARDAGAAVALFTTDLDELYALADRALFLSRGEIHAGNDAAAVVGGLD